MIPGLKAIPAFNGAGSTGSGGSLTLSFAVSSNSSSSTITIPGTAIAGDVAVLIDCAVENGSGSVSSVTPSGWTKVADTTVTSVYTIRTVTSYRILTAGQPGTSITGMNAYTERKFILVFRPSTSIVTATASTWNSEGTPGDPSTQTVSASGVATPLVVVAVAGAANTTSIPAFTTETPAMTNLTAGTNAYLRMRVGYTVYNSSPSNQSIDTGDNGANTLHSGYIRFT